MRKTGRIAAASSLALITVLTVAISANAGRFSGTLLSDSVSETTRSGFFCASEEEILSEYANCVGADAADACEYGGVFVDDDGNAVVNVKRSAASAQDDGGIKLTTSDGRNIIVREVKYSMAELKDAESGILELVPFVDGYVIREMGVDEEQNNIEVLIEEHENADGFLDILLEKIGLSEAYSDMFRIGVFRD